MSIFSSTIESIPCQSSSMLQARQCRGLNHDQSEVVGFGVCQVGSKCVWQYGYNQYHCRPRHHGTEFRIGIWHRLIERWRYFRWQWQWHRWHYWHRRHTVACTVSCNTTVTVWVRLLVQHVCHGSCKNACSYVHMHTFVKKINCHLQIFWGAYRNILSKQ